MNNKWIWIGIAGFIMYITLIITLFFLEATSTKIIAWALIGLLLIGITAFTTLLIIKRIKTDKDENKKEQKIKSEGDARNMILGHAKNFGVNIREDFGIIPQHIGEGDIKTLVYVACPETKYPAFNRIKSIYYMINAYTGEIGYQPNLIKLEDRKEILEKFAEKPSKVRKIITSRVGELGEPEIIREETTPIEDEEKREEKEEEEL